MLALSREDKCTMQKPKEQLSLRLRERLFDPAGEFNVGPTERADASLSAGTRSCSFHKGSLVVHDVAWDLVDAGGPHPRACTWTSMSKIVTTRS